MTDRSAAVLDVVDSMRDDVIGATGDLVRIPSVGGTDAECDVQQHVADVLAGDGYDVDHWRLDLDELTNDPDFPGVEVERDEAWGVVGRLPGAAPDEARTLMLNGHVDVVPTGDADAWHDAPFDATVRSGSMFGRGTCDMKAGLVASIVAARAIRQAGIRLRGDLIVASVVGEEDGGLGTFATLKRGWTADACVIGEPTDLDVIPANAGALTFRLRIRGLATHAARRTDGVSAIDKFVPVLDALHRLEERRHADVDPLAARWERAHPLSIGAVHAGDWASSVPDLLVAEGRLGVAVGEPMEEARRQLEEAVAAVCADDSWLSEHPVEVEWWGGQFASGRLPDDSDLIDVARSAHGRATNGSDGIDVYAAPYGSDLRLLTGIGGIPTIQYGPGDVALAHGPLERVEIDDVMTAARAMAVMAIDVCGVA
ncbi:MAG: ArgE/DapE family deacylase [Actinomycetota bacterium]